VNPGRPLAAVVLVTLLLGLPAAAAESPKVIWHPQRPQVGDVAWVEVRGVPDASAVEGSLGDRTLVFFPYAGGQVAVTGIDLEVKPGPQAWRLAVLEPGREPRRLSGRLVIQRRDYPVQRLTLPETMVDLDPEAERRAVSEAERLKILYQTITPERLWRGRFARPVAGHDPPTGFGARRIINGKPRAPHSGADYAAERGTPVVAANSGRVALVADFFFPGRLVALDHGLGLYTLYFHLDSVAVADGEMVDRGQRLGTVGATGRATGPHLHFGAQLAGSRVDPAALFSLDFRD
jgi:murein DD-endopeptidase MepM/ murein hydrolase activator NlpD